MPTSKEEALALLAGIPEVRIRSMMGEWLVYFREQYLGTIENGRLFLKDTPRSRAYLTGMPLVSPHLGARPAFLTEGRSAEELFRLFSDISFS